MTVRVPEYFISFRCIADKCRDSCCIGWEIDVDPTSRQKYEALECDIGREIAEKTSHGCFPLQENGRCAFLDERGLCRIISSLSDEYLCDICREHPRYYGVGDGVYEGGLGLGCEEAARMMLALNEKPTLVEIDRSISYSDEDDFADVSEHARELLYDKIFTEDIHTLTGSFLTCAGIFDDVAFEVSTTGKRTSLPTSLPSALDEQGAERIYESILELLSECEALTGGWYELVDKTRDISVESALDSLDSKRGLLYYFTHRYVREGVEDMSLGQRIAFALGSSLVISAMALVTNREDPDVFAAVDYSKNVEYSTDNVDYILENIEFL